MRKDRESLYDAVDTLEDVMQEYVGISHETETDVARHAVSGLEGLHHVRLAILGAHYDDRSIEEVEREMVGERARQIAEVLSSIESVESLDGDEDTETAEDYLWRRLRRLLRGDPTMEVDSEAFAEAVEHEIEREDEDSDSNDEEE